MAGWGAAARPGTSASAHHVVGREAEVAVLHGFLDRAGARALVVTGDAGIGKTTLWEAGVDAAAARGFRVLSAKATSAEARLSHAALTDLLSGVGRDELAGVPEPQIYALEVALLRAEPAAAPPVAGVALGVLNALRALSDRPLLIASTTSRGSTPRPPTR